MIGKIVARIPPNRLSSITNMDTHTRKSGTFVSAYLILRQKDQILLLLRQNTGYCDGQWGLVAGHVEEGESATVGIIREASEEAGLTLFPSQLKTVHIMHRKTPDRLNIDVFFEHLSWDGLAVNTEPKKCVGFQLFPHLTLPSNTMDYVAAALRSIQNGEFYSEWGWQT